MKSSFTLNEIHYSSFGKEELINRPSLSPDRSVLNNIFSYARAMTIVKTKDAGHFILLMN